MQTFAGTAFLAFAALCIGQSAAGAEDVKRAPTVFPLYACGGSNSTDCANAVCTKLGYQKHFINFPFTGDRDGNVLAPGAPGPKYSWLRNLVCHD